MEDWVALTEEDIERATRLARDHPPTPDVLTITVDDVAGIPENTPASEAVLTITAADLGPSPLTHRSEPDLAPLEQLMTRLINATRKHHLPNWLGTAQLQWHPALATVSRQHSTDMLRRQYVSHVTPEGVTPARRLQHYGIRYLACGENIGIVYGEAAHSARAIYDIHRAFMRQPRSLTNHRGNLLNPIWTHVGIGIAYNPNGALVATQNFISAPTQRRRGTRE